MRACVSTIFSSARRLRPGSARRVSHLALVAWSTPPAMGRSSSRSNHHRIEFRPEPFVWPCVRAPWRSAAPRAVPQEWAATSRAGAHALPAPFSRARCAPAPPAKAFAIGPKRDPRRCVDKGRQPHGNRPAHRLCLQLRRSRRAASQAVDLSGANHRRQAGCAGACARPPGGGTVFPRRFPCAPRRACVFLQAHFAALPPR